MRYLNDEERKALLAACTASNDVWCELCAPNFFTLTGFPQYSLHGFSK